MEGAINYKQHSPIYPLPCGSWMWHVPVEGSPPPPSPLTPLWLDECRRVRANANDAPEHPRRFRSVWNSLYYCFRGCYCRLTQQRDAHIHTSRIHTRVHKHIINSQDVFANRSTHLCMEELMRILCSLYCMILHSYTITSAVVPRLVNAMQEPANA